MDKETLENELNCTICLDTYTDPKILQCFHVYCQKCLVKLVVRDQQEQLSLSCPTCRQATPVPARGTAGLPSAFRVNRLLEILDHNKTAKGEAASAERVDCKAESLPSALCCSEHDGREVELFCETCGELICYKCAVKGGKHHSHDYKDIHESFEQYKEAVAPSLEPLEKKMTALSKVLTQLDKHCDEITKQHGSIEAEIRESSKQLHDIISNRQDQLVSQLDHITKRKLKSLSKQRGQIETLKAQLNSCLELTRESLKTGIDQCEVLVMKTNILKRVQELATPSQPHIFTPTLNTEGDVDVVFSGSAEAVAVCESYGRVYALNSPDISKCFATDRGTEEAVVGEKATATLEAVTFKGEPCSEASMLMCFQIELVSEITGGKVFGSVERSMEQGQYVISYQPTVKGRHQLHIKADGQHIRGSPFCVTVTLPVEKLGTPILILSELGKPWGVAVNEKGEVIVPELHADRVSMFSPHGNKLRSFGINGSGEGQLVSPSDVAVDGEGNLLVLDKDNYRIQKFTADGNFLQAVGSKGNGPLQFDYPNGITYSASNNKVYVADTYNHCVQVLTSDLRFISMFGEYGSGKGQFSYPRGVSTDSSGRVYVADCGNHRIQVFTAEGRFLRMFGREGRGKLNGPRGVGVDASGLVYVSEHGDCQVSVFTSEGKILTTFGSGQLEYPGGLAVDDSGVVYVCDYDCVKLF